MSKDNQAKTFWQNKGLYVVLLIAALVIITVAIVLAATAAGGEATQTLDNEKTSSLISASASASASASKSASVRPSSSGAGSASQSAIVEEPTPAASAISFIMPVENGTCIKDYTEASVVYNKTLGLYTGHMGMDITGEDGARVLCVYDGEVTAITSSYLTGTTVTVTHKNGLKSIYNSIEAADGLSVGDKVKQGDVLGAISDNNRQEYKDGAHLHFEVEEDGVKVSPTKYFIGYDK
ncbi:MAG: M23 family metallopeptidase [Clostridia bacterium]|nr:M23 family metallopeptidase [Clostridia bacterium]